MGVAANRDASDAEIDAKAAIYRDRLADADERRSKHLRTTAKAGVVALRTNLNRSRRAALASVIQKSGELHSKRCMMAESNRQAELGAKVAAAKGCSAKRNKTDAMHKHQPTSPHLMPMTVAITVAIPYPDLIDLETVPKSTLAYGS